MSPLALDPVFSLALRWSLALLLGSAAWHKLADVDRFRRIVYAYEISPESLVRPVGAAIAWGEAAIAAALLIPAIGRLASIAAAALLLTYTAAIAIALARGKREIDCGCGGPDARQPLSEALLVRNAVLVAVALAAALPSITRALLWVDWLSIVATVGCAALLWTSAERLIAIGAARTPRSTEGAH